MPGLVVTLSGNDRGYEAMLARSINSARVAGIKMQQDAVASLARQRAAGVQLSLADALRLKAAGLEYRSLGTVAAETEAWKVVANRTAMDKITQQEHEQATAEQAIDAERLAVFKATEEAKTLAADVGGATRSNRARALWRQRAVGRLDKAVAAESVASDSIFWFSSSDKKEAAAAATAERIVAQTRVAALTSVAFAAERVAVASTHGAHSVANFRAGIGELVVIAREFSRGNYSKMFSSMSIAAQRFGASLVSALVSIPGLIAVAVGVTAFFVVRHFKKMAEEAKNLADALNPLKKSFTDLAEAEKKAAEAAQEYADWRKDLLETHKSESDQIERKIKLLKEEAEARGLSNRATLELEKQLLLTEDARLKTQEDKALAATDAAAKAAQAGVTGIDFSTGKVINLDDAQAKSKRLGAISDAAETMSDQTDLAQVIAGLKTGALGPSRGHTRQQDINSHQSELDSTVMEFKVGTESFSMSLADAKKNFDLASAQAKKLETDQKALDDALKDSKKSAAEIAAARGLVASDLTDINDELAHPVKERGGRADVTTRERIGAAGNMVATQLDISKQHLAVSKETNAKLEKIIEGHQGQDGGIGGAFFA